MALAGAGALRRMSATYQAATGDSSRWLAAGWLGVGAVAPIFQRDGLAAAGEAGVEPGEIRELEAEAAQRDGKRRLGALGQHRVDADLGQAAEQFGRAQRLQHLDGRDVERLGERHAHRHRAVPVLVEVLRHIDAEAGRAVLDQRIGVGEAGLEGEPVDDGLQASSPASARRSVMSTAPKRDSSR